MQYRKKPVVIEAILYTGDNDDEVIKFTNGSAVLRSTVPFSPEAPKRDRGYVLSIETKEGIMNCSPGDYMIKEPFPTGDRDFYPCKSEIFGKTYEPMAKESFKDRLITEKTDLNEKRKKLHDFMASPAFMNVDPVQQSLLHVQFHAMQTYGVCLTERISWLEKNETKTEPIAGSNGIQAEPDEDLNQVTAQGDIHIGAPL